MKTRIILLLLTISALTYSCKKDNGETDDKLYVTALKNGTAWSATPEVNTYQDTLYLFAQANEEVLTMKIKYNGPGTYTLTGGQAYNWITVGGDVIVGEYRPNSSALSTITIASYDPLTKIAAGTFDLKLIQTRPTTANPLQVNFASGKFRTAISL